MIQRYNYIDRLKGFTILLVVIGHILAFSMIGDRNPIKFDKRKWTIKFVFNFMHFVSGIFNNWYFI